MAEVRERELLKPHGGFSGSMLLVDRLEVQADALPAGTRVLVVDDVLATGGTLRAATALLRRQGADVIGAAVLVELSFLHGRARWDDPAPMRAALVV